MPKTKRQLFGRKNLNIYQRKTGTKNVKPTILIVCEGGKTEPNYFKAFRVSSVRVEIIGAGCDPVGVVEKAIERKGAEDPPFDQVWSVFDRDDWPRTRFNTAVQRAQSNDIRLACSIEAFELWYVLHFDYQHAALHRSQYIDILNQRLGKHYQKNSQTMYEELLDRQEKAIKFSKILQTKWASPYDYDNSPSTTVFRLVEELNKYL